MRVEDLDTDLKSVLVVRLFLPRFELFELLRSSRHKHALESEWLAHNVSQLRPSVHVLGSRV